MFQYIRLTTTTNFSKGHVYCTLLQISFSHLNKLNDDDYLKSFYCVHLSDRFW